MLNEKDKNATAADLEALQADLSLERVEGQVIPATPLYAPELGQMKTNIQSPTGHLYVQQNSEDSIMHPATVQVQSLKGQLISKKSERSPGMADMITDMRSEVPEYLEESENLQQF